MNVTLENAEIFGSVLSREIASVGGGWRCFRSAPGLPQLPPATSKNPPPFIASLLLFGFRGNGSNPYSIWTAGGTPILSKKRSGKSHFGIILVLAALGIWRVSTASRSLVPVFMQTKQDPREPVLLMALKFMLHAKLCLSVIILLIYVCWHPEWICRALLSGWGQRGQVRLIECLNPTACFSLYRIPVLYFKMMHLALSGT